MPKFGKYKFAQENTQTGIGSFPSMPTNIIQNTNPNIEQTAIPSVKDPMQQNPLTPKTLTGDDIYQILKQNKI